MRYPTISEQRVLSSFIEAAAQELEKSNLVAALELHKMFIHLSAHDSGSQFDQSICWVRSPKDESEVNKRYRISPLDVADYMNNCMFQRTISCSLPDGSRETVSDEFVMFNSTLLMEKLDSLGYAWVPRRGIYRNEDIPVDPVVSVFVSPLAMPYETQDLRSMQLAASKYWVNYDRNRPPLQKTVSAYIAEQIGLSCANRKTDTLAAAIRPGDAPTER